MEKIATGVIIVGTALTLLVIVMGVRHEVTNIIPCQKEALDQGFPASEYIKHTCYGKTPYKSVILYSNQEAK